MDEKTTIQINNETWKQLHFRKERGETFDDVIQDLLTAEIKEAEPGMEPELVDYEETSGVECSNIIPDRGQCNQEADYVLHLKGPGGNVTKVPYCEEHANL